jgi:CrcB protein
VIWYVALGSAVGGVTRYWLTQYIQRASGVTFPLGTLLINVTGSFLLGLLLRFALDTPAVSPELRLALTTGFCGGYTTFSTFSYETVALVDAGDWRRAALYVALSVVASLVAAFAGVALARELVALRAAR